MLRTVIVLCFVVVACVGRRTRYRYDSLLGRKVFDFKRGNWRMHYKLRKNIVNQHNWIRGHQGSTDMNKLYWSDSLAMRAAMWNDECIFKKQKNTHRPTGENEYAKETTDLVYPAAKYIHEAINAWYAADESYDYEYGESDKQNPGRYTHVLTANLVTWADTQKIGCSFRTCYNPSQFPVPFMYLVCFYTPMGNIVEELPWHIGGGPCFHCRPGQSCSRDGNDLCQGHPPCRNNWGDHYCRRVSYVQCMEHTSGATSPKRHKSAYFINCYKACGLC